MTMAWSYCLLPFKIKTQKYIFFSKAKNCTFADGKIISMRKCAILLFVLLFAATLAARKPADTLSARRWEFVQNLGQWDAAVRFSANTGSGALFFETNAFTVAQLHPQQLQDLHEAKHY